MNTENLKPNYCITASSWQKSTQEGKDDLIQLIKTDLAGGKEFCRLYFEKFLLVHEIAHIIQDMHRERNQIIETEAEKEYFANVFAVTYFRFKKEDKYLSDLIKWIDYLFDAYNVKIFFHLESFDHLLQKYKEERKMYGLLQFVLIKKAMESNLHLNTVIEKISTGAMKTANTSIILSKGIFGRELVDECLNIIFNINEAFPVVELEYVQQLGFQTLEQVF